MDAIDTQSYSLFNMTILNKKNAVRLNELRIYLPNIYVYLEKIIFNKVFYLGPIERVGREREEPWTPQSNLFEAEVPQK